VNTQLRVRRHALRDGCARNTHSDRKRRRTHPEELLEPAVVLGLRTPVLVGVDVEKEVTVRVSGAVVMVSVGCLGGDVVDGVVWVEVEVVVVEMEEVEEEEEEEVVVEVVCVVVEVLVVVEEVEVVVEEVVGGVGVLVGVLVDSAESGRWRWGRLT